MKKIFILLPILFFAFFSQAQYKYLKGVLSASQTGPTVNSFGSGVVIVRYNTVTRLLEHWGNFRGLAGTISNQHIHTGAPGVAGAITVPLTRTGGTNDGGLFGSQVLTAAQEIDLLAGNMYTNVHSSPNYGSGEIRAQLTQTTDGQTEFLNARLQGAQSTPPNASVGTGIANALIDKATHTVYLTGTYSGLTTSANNAHIHIGAPNVSGGIIVPLNWVASTSGSLDTTLVINTTNETAILTGGTYVNIHSSAPYAAGEIRGQLLSATNLRYLAGALQGSQETAQPNTSTARGTVIVRYNTQTNLLEFTGDYQSLNATISGSHIHGPAAPGADAAVLFNLTNSGGTMGTLTGSFTLTEPQEVDLLAGNMYANVHSTGTYANGEIRAQLIPQSSGETQYLTGVMQASQSVATPAVVSSGTGSTTVLLDKLTRNIYVTGSYSALTSGITNTHIHRGAAGTNGLVSIQLQYVAGTTSGTVTGSALGITQTLADSIINGSSYLNIHSSNFTAGEIRAQLGDLVLPVLLKYFNGYKEQNKIALIWETEQQINLDRYEIEQQNPETGKWISKSSIPATSTGTLGKLKFSDAPTNYNSTYVIYRLKMIDKDGKISYSQVVKINYKESKAELMIFGNPVVKGELNYILTGLSSDSKTEVSVVDYSGKIVIKTIGRALINNKVNISSLSSGMYKLVVKFDDNVLQQSFMK